MAMRGGVAQGSARRGAMRVPLSYARIIKRHF